MAIEAADVVGEVPIDPEAELRLYGFCARSVRLLHHQLLATADEGAAHHYKLEPQHGCESPRKMFTNRLLALCSVCSTHTTLPRDPRCGNHDVKFTEIWEFPYREKEIEKEGRTGRAGVGQGRTRWSGKKEATKRRRWKNFLRARQRSTDPKSRRRRSLLLATATATE